MDEPSVTKALQVATAHIERVADIDARRGEIASLRRRATWRERAAPLLAAAVAMLLLVGGLAAVRTAHHRHRRLATPTTPAEARHGWQDTAASPLTARQGATMVWTGREVIVWGGLPVPLPSGNQFELAQADGAALDPVTGTWRRIAPAPLAARYDHVSVWTGKEMIVWGGVVNASGRQPDGTSPNDGAAYDPATDTWRRIAASPLRSPRSSSLSSGQVAVWAGTEMMVFGRTVDTGVDHAGAAYDPVTDSWRSLPPIPGVAQLSGVSLIWTGTVVIAYPRAVPAGDKSWLEGDALDPAANAWTALPHSGLVLAGHALLPVWSGQDLIAVGAYGPGPALPPGAETSARYRPADGTWNPIAPLPVTGPVELHPLGWTGQEVLVAASPQPSATGDEPILVAYRPATDSWRPVSGPAWPGVIYDAISGAGGVVVMSGPRLLIFRS